MSRDKHKGKSAPVKRRVGVRDSILGYYIILTDGKETEKNYLNGLRENLPEGLRNRIVIKVKVKCTKDLIDECLVEKSRNVQYASMWIMLDRDQVKDFDELIKKAEKNDIQVAWSNPCIEAWFLMYYGKSHFYNSSENCIGEFKKKYKDLFNREYEKNSSDIYEKLNQTGDELKAIGIAEKLISDYLKDNCNPRYSDMNPGSTVHLLVEEIREKVSENVQ